MDYALRVADRHVPEAPRFALPDAPYLKLRHAVRWTTGEVPRRKGSLANVHRARIRPGDRGADRPRGSVNRELVLLRPAAVAQIHDRLARAVARQLGLRTVGVINPQVGHICGVLRAGELKDAVGEHAEMPLAEPSHPRRRELEGQLVVLDDQIVVSQCLPLLKSHLVSLRSGSALVGITAAESRRISSATSLGSRMVTSITRTPASFFIHVSWRFA